MKKVLFLFLFLFISFSSFGIDLTEALLKYNKIDLTQGIVIPNVVKLNDFSKSLASNKDFSLKTFKIYSENEIYAGYATESFYNLDFAEDPFDGLIEIWVVGEPSTSTTMTLLISCFLGLCLWKYKKTYSIQL